MSEPQKHAVRSEEPELNDEALEQVAGGCQWGCSADSGMFTMGPTDTIGTYSQTRTYEPNK
jgi:hypothetical protein